MRVALDIRPALRQGTGVGTFVEQLVLALDDLPGDHRLLLFTSSWKDRWPTDRLSGLRRGAIIDRRWPVKYLNLLWNRLSRPRIETFIGPTDVTHSPTPLIIPSRARKVVTLHDLHFLRRPEHAHGEIRRDYPALVRRHAALADAVLSVSEATARDAQELLGIPREKIVVCGEDASPVFDAPPGEEEMQESAALAPQPFVLFVGTIEPRKNLPALLQAYSYLQPRFPELRLVVAGGRGWALQEFDAAWAALPKPEKVIVTGYLEKISLRSLYHRAELLVMPSLCEGFGLPLVEAMACGCPLIVADNSSLPEVAGDAALYWRSGDPRELATLMGDLLEDRGLRKELIERGRRRRARFSWKRTAEIVLQVYRELTGKSQ
jgi:glycosyltransferase involved in cell wall biosynthesis